MFLGPLPRQRLYTTWGGYCRLVPQLLGLGRKSDGRAVQALEDKLCAYTGAAHAVAVSMARTGIYLTLSALISPGTRVLMSPYTIADVVNMVVSAGGVPVFCDVERETGNISADEVVRRIDDNVGCVLVTHFYGMACDIERIAELCRDRGLPLVEDCAQALGTRVGGRLVGTFGVAGVFSFGLYKNATGFLGGAVVTSSAELARSIKEALEDEPVESSSKLLGQVIRGAIMDIATYPLLFRALTYWVFRFGYLRRASWAVGRFDFDSNAQLVDSIPSTYLRRLSDAQATVILSALNRIDGETSERIDAARIYHEALAALPGLQLPPWRSDRSHIYQYFAVQCADRYALVDEMMREGRDVALSHHRNCADLPCFDAYYSDCPNARRVAGELIYLPTYPGYGSAEICKNITLVRRFLQADDAAS